MLKTRDQSELVNIGRVTSAVGLRGEVKVSGDSENLKEGKNLLLRRGKQEIEARCTGARYQKNTVVIKIEGITDRNAAEELVGYEVSLRASELDKLPEGQHYVRDIVGYSVYDRASGETIGTLQDVIQNTAQNVLDIESNDGKQIMIPAVDAFMRGIDDDKEVIEVELIPGFL